MDNKKYIEALKSIIGDENVKENESMSKHTSFRVGGNADIYIEVDSLEKLSKILDIKRDIPLTIIGNGSNVLVKDNGIRGVVLRYTAKNYTINNEEDNVEVEVDAGVVNAYLAQILMNNSTTGFEFASGIPGTIGGAIYMNAGAYGKEMKNIVSNVTYLDLKDNTIHCIERDKCKFEYRKSIFMNKDAIILKARLIFTKGEKNDIKAMMDFYKEKRVESQPIEFPNGGSTFKRGDGFITAKLIDDAGLKGKRIGGAEISKKHAGFIINADNATAKDILELSKYVQDEVFKKFNKKIELEVRILGE